MQPSFVSRGGEKLSAALDHFEIPAAGLVCADLGSHIGGFVDCLLRRGAARVYSVDTCYGTLAWRLRRDPRVVVLERTNAMHVSLPEPVDLVTIDVAWTRQTKVLPNVARMIRPGGCAVTLIKPHYEAPKDELRNGVLPDRLLEPTLNQVLDAIRSLGWRVRGTMDSPIRGHAGNREVIALLEHSPLLCSEPRASARADSPGQTVVRPTENRYTKSETAIAPDTMATERSRTVEGC